MFRFSLSGWLAAMLFAMDGCNASSSARAADTAARAPGLGQIVERYWDENAALMPWYSWGAADARFAAPPLEIIAPQSLADSRSLEQRYLQQVAELPRSTLDAESQLTYEIFRRERALAVEGFTYPLELLPVNPYDGMPIEYAMMAPAAERLAVSGDSDYERWRSRALGFVAWTSQAVANMRDGMRRGYTVPRVLVEKMLPQLAALGEDTPENVFYRPLGATPGGRDAERDPPADGDGTRNAEPGRSRLAAANFLVRDRILPAYRALHDFLLREYLPRARTSVAWSALPLGDAWYAYLVKRMTGGAATPAQLHALGLAEMARLDQRVLSLLDGADARSFLVTLSRGDARFSGQPPDAVMHQTPDAAVHAYEGLQVEVAAALPAAFSAFPRSGFVIRGVDAYRETATPVLSYRPRAPNGLSGAVLYVNPRPYPLSAALLAPQYLGEALPGRHYQIELQRERADLPRFRRFGGAQAFVDGWALYAATLGEELGLYRNTESKLGALIAQIQCAAILVVDTGVHAQGWTRQQALDYVRAQVPLDDAAAEEMVDRSLALPADGLPCTVGFLKIQGLRSLAQQALGANFDLRAFHAAMMQEGAIPLDLLEVRIKSWVEAGVAAAAAARREAAAPRAGDSS